MNILKSVAKAATALANPAAATNFLGDAIGGDDWKSMIPGIGDAMAQDKANKQNVELYNANQKWMEMMSNTAYQRSMADMEKAGLNPILAYQQGGASVPSSSAPTVQAASKTGLADFAMKSLTGISAAQSQASQASTAQSVAESSAKLQTASAAKEVALTQEAQVRTSKLKQEMRGKGIKDTLDREGGRIIQNLLDKIGGSATAKEKAENQRSPMIKVLGPASKQQQSIFFPNKNNKE